MLWRYRGDGSAISALTLSWDGATLYFASASGAIAAVAASSGAVLWTRTAPCPKACTFAAGIRGALTRNGRFILAAAAPPRSPQGFNGTIAVNTRTGNVTWTLPTAAAATALALDSSGLWFAGDAAGTVSAVNSGSGAVRTLWRSATGGVIPNGLAIGGGNGAAAALYVATPGAVVALASARVKGELLDLLA